MGALFDYVGPTFLIVAAVFLARRGFRAESLYVGGGVVLVLISGDLVSSGRYATVLFPAFWLGSDRVRSVRLGLPAVIVAFLLQLYLIARFVNNCWVA